MDRILQLLLGGGGINDPRSLQGIFSRGSNIYNGASSAAHSGGGIDYPAMRQSPSQPSFITGDLTPPQGLAQAAQSRLQRSAGKSPMATAARRYRRPSPL